MRGVSLNIIQSLTIRVIRSSYGMCSWFCLVELDSCVGYQFTRIRVGVGIGDLGEKQVISSVSHVGASGAWQSSSSQTRKTSCRSEELFDALRKGRKEEKEKERLQERAEELEKQQDGSRNSQAKREITDLQRKLKESEQALEE
jgi:hypothetical protein